MTLMLGKLPKMKSDAQRRIVIGTLRVTLRRIDELVFEMYGLSEGDVKVLMQGLKDAGGQRSEAFSAKTHAVATEALF
jgi:hypothetical protein